MNIKTLNPLYILLIFTFLSCSTEQVQNVTSDEEAMIKAFEWQEQHPIFALAPTDWTNGAYYTGVTKAYQLTQDQKYLAALKNMGYRNHWKPHERTHHADDIAISYSYLFLSTTRKNLVDIAPTKNWMDQHLFEINQWNNITIGNKSEKILWWWCDALFMAPPVLAYYSELTGETEYIEAMHTYYLETYELLFDKEEKLFARDLRFIWKGDNTDIKEENGNKVFWSRGNGWVIGGLALILEHLPKENEHRNFYENLFKTMAARILEIQPEDGLWRTSLLAPENFNHGEVSGSGFFTFALAWGINNGILDKAQYEPTVKKALKALRACQHDNGMVGWVQNIGDSPKPADESSWQNYGTGAFLLAGSEMIKLEQN